MIDFCELWESPKAYEEGYQKGRADQLSEDKELIEKGKAYDQAAWERNVAIAQLSEFDCQFGEDPECAKNRIIADALESVVTMVDDWGYADITSIVLKENLDVVIKHLRGEDDEM